MVLTFFRTKNNEIGVSCGYFIGDIKGFEIAVRNKHNGTVHEQIYLRTIGFTKIQILDK